MLEQIRDWTKGWFAWVIIILLAFVFTLWGVYGYMGVASTESEIAVTVNGQDIPRVTVERLAQRLQQDAIANGQKVQLDELRQEATEQLIIQTLLLQDAEKHGFAAHKKTVDHYILQLPEFQADGKFSPELFEQLSRQAGYTPYDLRQIIADDVMVAQLRAGIMGSAFMLPNEIARFLSLQMQTRDIQYLTFPVDYFVKKREISEDEIQQYYTTHSQQWVTPEQVSIEYIELTAEDAAKGINITDAEIQAYYDQNLSQYMLPEQRHVRHILLALPENASTQQMDEVIDQGIKIKEQLQKGGDFATLAKEYSIDTSTAEKGGDLGWINSGILPEPLDKAVFAADANTVLDPILTPYGVDITQVVAIKPAQTQSLDAVRDEIAQQLHKQRMQQRFTELQEELATLSYEMPDSLVEVAEVMQLPLKTSAAFTAASGANDPITANPVVRETAFSELVLGGENSSVITLAPEHILVLRIKDHQISATKPLDQVRAEVIKAIQDDEALTTMRKQLNAWVSEFKNGQLTEAEIAERLGGGPWKVVPKLSREASDATVPAALRDYAFNLPAPISSTGRSAGWLPVEQNQYAVVLVTQVNQGAVPAQDDGEWIGAASGLTLLQQQADYMAYIQQLRNTAEIKIH